MLNTVYALLAERARADDLAEYPLLLQLDADKRDRSGLCQNRAALDSWLAQPMGIQAAADLALVRELRGEAG